MGKDAPQVAQLRAERENALAYGDVARVAKLDRLLEQFDVRAKAGADRKSAAESGIVGDAGKPVREPRSQAPAGRSPRPREETSNE